MAEDGKQEPKLKVTDKRMFTADGELREDFRHLDSDSGGAEAASEAPPEPEAATRAAAEPASDEPVEAPPAGDTDSERAGRAAGAGATGLPAEAGFLHLVSTLAEPIALYLGDARLPDGSSAENLDAARFYIDLLDVLRDKTAGNLTPAEHSMLDDLLYQLRMRYVAKRG